MTIQTTVAIYARTNTDAKSPDPQFRALRQHAAAREWTDVKEYADIGVSGCAKSRPAWDKLWQAIQDGQVQVLIVKTIDRLTRSMPHLQEIAAVLADQNVTLIVSEDCADLSAIVNSALLTGNDKHEKSEEAEVEQ